MRNEEAVQVLTEDMELWARVMGHFEKNSVWFKESLDRVKALRIAIKAIKEVSSGGDKWRSEKAL